MPPGNRPNPPAHVARITINGNVLGSRWANVFWLRNGNAQTPGTGDFLTVVEAVASAYANTLAHAMSHESVADLATGLYYGPTGEAFGADQPIDAPGQHNDGSLPVNVACAISWQLVQRYRGGHPRTYIAGIAKGSQFSPKSLDTAFTSSLADLANDFHRRVNGSAAGAFSSIHLGTVSFVLRKQWRDPPVFRDYVPEGAHVDVRIDSQRRRLGPDIP